jgi:hypothetical protein
MGIPTFHPAKLYPLQMFSTIENTELTEKLKEFRGKVVWETGKFYGQMGQWEPSWVV